jgi:hypothetical protein
MVDSYLLGRPDDPFPIYSIASVTGREREERERRGRSGGGERDREVGIYVLMSALVVG